MVLDDETKRKIEENRLEALKRLEERKRRLEQESSMKAERDNRNIYSSSNSFCLSALIPTAVAVKRLATSDEPRPRALPDSFLKPLPPTQKSAKTDQTALAANSNGIRAFVQLTSPTTFSITAITPVQTICRQIIDEVTFNRVDNTYTVPLNRYNFILEKLAITERPQAHQQIPKSVLAAFEPGQLAQRKAALSADYQIESSIGKDLYQALFPYQREGVKMAIARRGRLIIADEMGLGKSIQAIATAVYFRREWPLLILAPASMVASWHQQLLRWIPEDILSPSDVQVIYDGKVKAIDGIVTILSYDLAVKLCDLLQKRGFMIIIADECHALRNIETKRSKTLIPIIGAAERALLLSGTPALSRPIELFPQIQAINPKLLPKRHDYALRYCDAHKNYFGGWDMRGSANLTELQVILENCVMIRRMKDQVLTELPPKIRRQVFLKLPTASKNFKMFQMQTAEYLNNLGMEDMDNPIALESVQKKAEFMALWKRTAEIKLEAMIEYVEDLLDANHKMLIFAHHTAILDGFASNFISKVTEKNIKEYVL
jgi:SWI/SNF-related matrix-associated actin-dependent regulator of chromatin subfamily A-like protein 1